MRNIWAMATKELRIYLTTWTSYMLFGAFFLISSFFFSRLVIEFQLRSAQFMQMQASEMLQQLNLTDWVMGPLFMNITVFFLFMLPILTMRLFAEERRSKTLELLMTAPLRPLEIVLGKYLGALIIMSLMLMLTLLFPVLLEKFGHTTLLADGGEAAANLAKSSVLDWRSISIAYLGMLLLGSSFVAIGLFTSSVTDSQIVAVITSFALLLMFYVIGLAARGEEGFWQEFFSYISITNHLESFIRGIIRLPDVVYYLSLTFSGLFLTFKTIEAERWR